MSIKNNKKVVGFTAGNFDLIHPGYIYTFEEAKKHCDHFIVFLHSNPSEERNAKYKPVVADTAVKDPPQNMSTKVTVGDQPLSTAIFVKL